ncbi:unnamed protein product [Oncorhynchus mykiss]|uniref:Uncharacterized protein n=1 Tax=Oncorhynchus mykiss TaxID=8022 RepID=A0A060VZD4_ONCMY|nr:unnamed protein product [Oncorhynchus mykiss]
MFFIPLGYSINNFGKFLKNTVAAPFMSLFRSRQVDFKNSVVEKVFVEFSHQELLQFYNQLETVQAQLDSLT